MIHRVPLWLFGPLMLLSAVAADETGAVRAALAVGGAALSALITFPYLRRRWREFTGKVCPKCGQAFAAGDAVWRDVMSGDSVFHELCLPAGLRQPGWVLGVHGTPGTLPRPAAPRPAGDVAGPSPVPSAGCGSYRAGHRPHPIQVNRSSGTPGRLVRVAACGGGWLELVDEATGVTERVWTHDPQRAEQFVNAHHGRGMLRWNRVLVGPTGAGLVLSVAPGPSPCAPTPAGPPQAAATGR